jgi:alpha-maltose-1-phosphate synthase
MAAGKAVIASRVGGLPELVIDKVTGLLVTPRDIEGLANAISTLAGDKSLIRAMGKKGRERLKEKFTMEQTARQVEDYYFSLLERNGTETGSTLE